MKKPQPYSGMANVYYKKIYQQTKMPFLVEHVTNRCSVMRPALSTQSEHTLQLNTRAAD